MKPNKRDGGGEGQVLDSRAVKLVELISPLPAGFAKENHGADYLFLR